MARCCRDAAGERFVDELAPRDVVSRAMAARMAEQGTDHLWLDATGLERFSQRFPTIAASLTSIGLDPETDWLPIAPARAPPLGRCDHGPVGRRRAARTVGRGRSGTAGCTEPTVWHRTRCSKAWSLAPVWPSGLRPAASTSAQWCHASGPGSRVARWDWLHLVGRLAPAAATGGGAAGARGSSGDTQARRAPRRR